MAELHAVVLCGGSAPGLGAVDGVIAYLEERGLGYETLYARIPLVSGAVIYDRRPGDPSARPLPADGYRAAARAAEAIARRRGRVAWAPGTGATVGKILGEDPAG